MKKGGKLPLLFCLGEIYTKGVPGQSIKNEEKGDGHHEGFVL